MKLFFKNLTNFTSEEFDIDQVDGTPATIMIRGTGTVVLFFMDAEGVFRDYPETTLTGPTATRLHLPQGKFKLTVTAATPTSVEIHY